MNNFTKDDENKLIVLLKKYILEKGLCEQIIKQIREPVELYIPLQYWFNRNHDVALPTVALSYNDIKINFKFKE